MISTFNDLINILQNQTNPQRLLLLFANAESTDSHNNQNGFISPVMCVDKSLSDITSFHHLIKEADEINKQWNFMFVASLSGEKDKEPTTTEAEPFLNKMAHDIETGNSINRYVIFDREENPIEIEAN